MHRVGVKLYVARLVRCAGFDYKPCTDYAHYAQLYKRVRIFVRTKIAGIVTIGITIR